MNDILDPGTQGNPESLRCRHCGGPKIRVRNALFCDGACDSGQIDGVTRRATWRPS